jgi:hypothetical protein
MRGLRGTLFVALTAAALFLVAAPPASAAEISINWSGYAVDAKPGESITGVTGSWLVPKIKHAPPGLSSSWIGVGGYATSDLIQVGTASSGLISGNYAWYEMLPAAETRITSGCVGDNACTVKQADRMVGSVINTGGNGWRITLTNFGKGGSPKWTWAKNVTYASTRSSAELIYEAPMLGVAGFGVHTTPANAPHAQFLPGATFVVNGATRPFATARPHRIHMNDPGAGRVRTATASLMAPDGHFQVCAYKTKCPNF